MFGYARVGITAYIIKRFPESRRIQALVLAMGFSLFSFGLVCAAYLSGLLGQGLEWATKNIETPDVN